MCYSAQIQAAYMKYLRETGAEMDIDQYRAAEVTKLEREVFAERKRLADRAGHWVPAIRLIRPDFINAPIPRLTLLKILPRADAVPRE